MIKFNLIVVIFIFSLLLISCEKSKGDTLIKSDTVQENITKNTKGEEEPETKYNFSGSSTQPTMDSGDTNESIIDKKEVTATGDTDITNLKGTDSTITGSIIGESKTESQDKKNLPKKFDSSLGFEPNNIKNIQTLDDLKKLVPNIDVNTPGVDNPKYIELQKNQMLISVYATQIKDPKYKKLQENQMNIIQGKEIWNKELIDLEDKISKAMSSRSTDLSELFIQKSNALKILQGTEEYREFIKQKQLMISAINTEMQKYWTPEIKELQGKIESLRKEIYQSPK